MIKVRDAERQVHRLSVTVDYHLKQDDAIEGYIAWMMQTCEDEEMAIEIVDRWLDENPTMPAISNLVELHAAIQKERAIPPKRTGCRLCDGTGFLQSFELCEKTPDDTLLRQPIEGGWEAAHSIMDGWRQEEREWRQEHSNQVMPPRRNQFIGQVGRRCACNPAPAAKA